MTTQNTGLIRVAGMQKLDALEMSDQFPKGSVSFEEAKMADGQHGELLTTAIVVLSALSIKALAAWLLKNNTRNRINKTVEVVDANGKSRKESINIDLSSSTAPDADVMKELSRITGFDLNKLLEKTN